MITEEKYRDIFEPDVPQEERTRNKREVIGLAENKSVNQLKIVPAVTVHYNLFAEIEENAKQKKLNIYVYKRSRGGRYRPKNKYYYGIFAVRSGVIKTTHPKELTDVVAKIEEFPRYVNHRKSSKQYKLLREFLQTIVLAG